MDNSDQKFQDAPAFPQTKFTPLIHDLIYYITRPWCLSELYLREISKHHPNISDLHPSFVAKIVSEIEKYQFPYMFDRMGRIEQKYRDFLVVIDIDGKDLREYSITKNGEELIKWTK